MTVSLHLAESLQFPPHISYSPSHIIMDNSSCFVCNKATAVYACACTVQLSTFCEKCIEGHMNKPSSDPHIPMLNNEIDRGQGFDLVHKVRTRKLNIDGGKTCLNSNLENIEECRQHILFQFGLLVSRINEVRDEHLKMLKSIEDGVKEAIEKGVKCAMQHVGAAAWDDSFGDPMLAGFVWKYPEQRDCPVLFSYSVSDPSTFINNLVKVTMTSKVKFASVDQNAKLPLIADGYLRLYAVKGKSWSSVELDRAKMPGFKHSSNSALAFYEGGNSLLCTGGGTPVTALCTRIDLDGSLTELPPMRYSRAGHGLCYLNGCFYAFCGYGSKRTAEKYSEGENQQGHWDVIRGLNESHEWFNACVINGKVVLCGGDSATIEEFDPVTETFTKLDFQLRDALAESSLSVCSDLNTLVILSCSYLLTWDGKPNAEYNPRQFAKNMRFAWSCITPIIDLNKVYLSIQEEKVIKCVDLATTAVEEIRFSAQDSPAA